MDKLDIIFKMQAELDEYLAKKRNLQFSTEEWIKMQTLAMISELAELLDEVNFKWWKNPKPIDDTALRSELVDILHFFVGMCLRAGMSAEDLFAEYLNKNAENYNRQIGKSDKSGYE